jgi:hypothetical protein
MIRKTLVALALLLPGAGLAAEPMSAAEFEAYVQGRTLTYNSGGTPYGAEEYLSNRRVRWAFLGDECVEGEWYENAGMICFLYENNEVPQCWTFQHGPGGLIATFENDPEQTTLYEARRSDEPLLCLGPKIGV